MLRQNSVPICYYAFFILRESAIHIQNNWTRAKYCLEKIQDIDSILNSPQQEEAQISNELFFKNILYIPQKNNEKNKVIEIWNQLSVIVLLFFLIFIGILDMGIQKIMECSPS